MIDIDEGGCKRIKNAAVRIKKTIYLVGSRASNTFTMFSDFDYFIPGLTNKEWKKIKNSLPGAKNYSLGKLNRIDLLIGQIDFTKPYVEITFNTNINECR